MNYLFLIDRLEMRPGATAICAYELAKSLTKKGNNVYVLCLGVESKVVEKDGIHLCTVKDSLYKLYYSDSTENSFLNKSIRLANKIASSGPIVFDHFEISMRYNNRALFKTASDVIREHDIGIVVSFSEPFGTQLVGSRLKGLFQDSIKWVAYEMDPFALNYFKQSSSERRRRKLETETLRNSDLIIMATGIERENYRKSHLEDYRNKTLTIPLPGFYLDKKSETFCSSLSSQVEVLQPIRLVYTGVFYSSFRSPAPLCALLSNVSIDYELHLVGDISKKEFKAFPGVLEHCVFYGHMSKDECSDMCKTADVLVDIQNDIPNQIPSKLLSYMSYNKKILSLYSDINTLGIDCLLGYPNSLCINKEQVRDPETIESFQAFCLSPAQCLSQEELGTLLEPHSHDAVVAKFLGATDRIID